MSSENARILTIHQRLIIRAPILSLHKYNLLRSYLNLPYCSGSKQYIFLNRDLILWVTQCLPQNSTSIHFSMIDQWCQKMLVDLHWMEQESLILHLQDPQNHSESQVMKETLITGFANYPIPLSSRSTLVQESSSSTSCGAAIEKKSDSNKQSLSLSDTSLAKLSSLRLIHS